MPTKSDAEKDFEKVSESDPRNYWTWSLLDIIYGKSLTPEQVNESAKSPHPAVSPATKQRCKEEQKFAIRTDLPKTPKSPKPADVGKSRIDPYMLMSDFLSKLAMDYLRQHYTYDARIALLESDNARRLAFAVPVDTMHQDVYDEYVKAVYQSFASKFNQKALAALRVNKPPYDAQTYVKLADDVEKELRASLYEQTIRSGQSENT